jgi:hypothetical protein
MSSVFILVTVLRNLFVGIACVLNKQGMGI